MSPSLPLTNKVPETSEIEEVITAAAESRYAHGGLEESSLSWAVGFYVRECGRLVTTFL